MNLIDIYKEMYYKENEIKTRIGTKIVPFITLLVTLTTAEVWTINNILELEYQEFLFKIIGYTILSISIIANIFVFYCFYKAHYGYTYKYVEVKKIEKYNKELSALADYYSEKELENLMDECIKDLFCEAACKNQKVNLNKIQNQNVLMNAYLVHFLFLIACFYWIIVN